MTGGSRSRLTKSDRGLLAFFVWQRDNAALTLEEHYQVRSHGVDFSLAIAGLSENLKGVLSQAWGELPGRRGSF